mmetsp:Transcript_45898/g.99426  ORF Transcript_45898/g.99426 Transcript_45898/m.99426 type:complete len:242 (+) Transcript_45898:927-1652(+)
MLGFLSVIACSRDLASSAYAPMASTNASHASSNWFCKTSSSPLSSNAPSARTVSSAWSLRHARALSRNSSHTGVSSLSSTAHAAARWDCASSLSGLDFCRVAASPICANRRHIPAASRSFRSFVSFSAEARILTPLAASAWSASRRFRSSTSSSIAFLVKKSKPCTSSGVHSGACSICSNAERNGTSALENRPSEILCAALDRTNRMFSVVLLALTRRMETVSSWCLCNFSVAWSCLSTSA